LNVLKRDLIGPNSFGAMAAAQSTMLIDLCPDDPEYVSVEDQLQNSIREHKDNCGGIFVRYNIVKVRSQQLSYSAITASHTLALSSLH